MIACPSCGQALLGHLAVSAAPEHADAIGMLLHNAGLPLPTGAGEFADALRRGPAYVAKQMPLVRLREVKTFLDQHGVSAMVESASTPASPRSVASPRDRRPNGARRSVAAPRSPGRGRSSAVRTAMTLLALSLALVIAFVVGADLLLRRMTPQLTAVRLSSDISDRDVTPPPPPPIEQAPPRSAASLIDSVVMVQSPSGGAGTAFAVIRPGLFLTNRHVATERRVTLVFQGQRAEGKVIRQGVDLDLALIECGPSHVCSRPVLPLGRASDLVVGDEVSAVGSPGGLDLTLTRGILSHGGRMFHKTMYLQTDLAVNPGNSGGPMVSRDGRVVGVVTAKIMQAEGIAFALPIEYALFGNFAILKDVSPESNRHFPPGFDAMLVRARTAVPIGGRPPPPSKRGRGRSGPSAGVPAAPQDPDGEGITLRKATRRVEQPPYTRFRRSRPARHIVAVEFVLVSSLKGTAPTPEFKLLLDDQELPAGRWRPAMVREDRSTGRRISKFSVEVEIPVALVNKREARVVAGRWVSQPVPLQVQRR